MRKELLLLPVLLAQAACVGGSEGEEAAGTHTVVYSVVGSAKSSTVSYTTPSGTSRDSDVELPWRKEFKAKGSSSLSVNAESGDGGEVGCSITVDGAQVASRTSSGQPVIAGCDSFIAP